MNLLKGLPGEHALQGDLVVTGTDERTTLFKVVAATGISQGPNGATHQGTLYKGVTPASTAAGTTPQVLQTYSLPAGALSTAGQAVRITAWGTYAANANVKTVSLTFGATTVATTGAVASNGTTWYCQADVFCLTGVTQTAVGIAQSGTTLHANTASAPAETLANAIVVTVTATDAISSAGDVVCTGMVVEYLP